MIFWLAYFSLHNHSSLQSLLTRLAEACSTLVRCKRLLGMCVRMTFTIQNKNLETF
jgi:hypothetical protein